MTSTVASPTPAPETVRATVVIEDESSRLGFLAWAERALPEGKVLVQVKDLHGRRRAFRTVPVSPRAELVAVEAPLILRGALTQVTSYWCLPADELAAEEVHVEDGHESHRYSVELRVTCRSANLRPQVFA